MTKLALLLAAAAAVATTASPAAAQVAGIATSSTEGVFFRAAARTAAYQQIQTQYAAQIQQIGTVRTEIQTLVKSLDTNNDNQLSDAERRAKPAVVTQIQQKEQQINTLAAPISLAQAYALDQIAREYDAARQQVVTAKRIQLLLSPDAIQWGPPTVDVTDDILAALNTRRPTVPIAVPAGWQPSQQIAQLHQTIQQISLAAAQQQAAQAQAAPAATTPAQPASQPPRPAGR
ncbi:OmpH family outer membrane protein [Qipengyuania sediminis]|uniref:OmpH family outer membrane protein n=1 Tax=Qipengyuania sediminis TaxID=1532023 RepID=UPI00105A9D01|nr:OmpH family outer membrane protein [Qipengyuania sediminis]